MNQKLYPLLFKKTGKGLIIGRNVTFRHPQNIVLGDNVTIDDNCLIDAHGAVTHGLVIEDQVIINRNCMIQARNGPILLRKRTSIGSNSVIGSMDGVEFGEAVLVAGGCYFSAGAYKIDDTEKPIMDHTSYTKGPIIIGSHSWIGTRVTVLDGVKIGEGAVIGACSLVNKDIKQFSIAYGIPAESKYLRSGIEEI